MAVHQPKINVPRSPAAALEDRTVLPAHAAYDQARMAWNLAVDQRPSAVVFPESAPDVAAAEYGLAALAGSSPDVGVVGYTPGGGMSFLGRKYGFTTNHVRAIELVTADGRIIRTDRETEPDLFWALRGGGGASGSSR